MKTRLLRIAGVAFILSLAHSSIAEPVGERCLVVGRVVDARTCMPLAYANVIVAGTTIGAITDVRGNYQLWDVPLGRHEIFAQALLIQRTSVTVDVLPGPATRVDFRLREIWLDGVSPKPTIECPRCPKHLVKMRRVLVPTQAACSVLMCCGEQNDNVYPYAWPVIKGEAVLGAMKVEWGPSCPKCVAERNAHFSQERWRGLTDSPRHGWKSYVVPGVVEFMGPSGLADSVEVDSCTLSGNWTAKNLRVVIRRVSPFREVFVTGIWVTQKPDCDYVLSMLSESASLPFL
jgi:hypothetical protein